MLIKHRPSHLAQGPVLVLKTQVMAKGFKMRVSEFRAIITADCSYGISVPLISQPQD
jgi:hypothetical protein